MSKNEDLILSLRAVLYACGLYMERHELKRYVSFDGSINYDDAISNVIDLIMELESEVEE